MFNPTAYFNSPIGWLEITASKIGIVSIRFIQMMNDIRSCCPGLNSWMNLANDKSKLESNGLPDCLTNCLLQLDEYFKAERSSFNIKLDLKGSEFRQNVWKELMNVEYGKTATYGDIAERIGNPKAARAVGNANNRNPIPIIIPCHRIIGSNGDLTGYAGGLWRKKWLLEFEKQQMNLFDR